MDTSTVLEKYTQDLSNLPLEIRHLLEEIKNKDMQAAELRKQCQSKDNQIHKFIRANGTLTKHPKEQQLNSKIEEDMKHLKKIQKEKILLANTALFLVSKHLFNFETDITKLERDELLPPLEIPVDLQTMSKNEYSNALNGLSDTLSATPTSRNALSVTPAVEPVKKGQKRKAVTKGVVSVASTPTAPSNKMNKKLKSEEVEDTLGYETGSLALSGSTADMPTNVDGPQGDDADNNLYSADAVVAAAAAADTATTAANAAANTATTATTAAANTATTNTATTGATTTGAATTGTTAAGATTGTATGTATTGTATTGAATTAATDTATTGTATTGTATTGTATTGTATTGTATTGTATTGTAATTAGAATTDTAATTAGAATTDTAATAKSSAAATTTAADTSNETTGVDDTTKSLSFVTTRVLRSTSSSGNQDSSTGSSGGSSQSGNGGALLATSPVLAFLCGPIRVGPRVCYFKGLRPISSPASYDYIKDYESLHKKIKASISKNPSSEEIVSAISSIKNFQSEYPIQDQLNSTSILTRHSETIIHEVFSNKEIEFTPQLLKQLFLLNLPTALNIKLINEYYRFNPKSTTIIEKSIALIPLRNALYNADFQRAVKISDVTVGHPNYIAHQGSIIRSGIVKLVSTAAAVTIFTKFGVTSLIDAGTLPASWDHLGAINSILLTYIINSSFFVTIVKFGRQLISSGGDYLTWQRGTFYSHWFKHADEMLFNSKIVEADRDLNNGESNPDITDEICRPAPEIRSNMDTLNPGYDREGHKIRLMQLKDDLEKLKFQAYWMTGGDGFEWVEPDQDPAEIQWRDHLEKYNKPALDRADKDALRWADDLIKES
ncbi:hypothetical protein CANMA_004872 [Candida margitis]|uniref:uncharacterized protein n=1 Tax=Candida margitis TaxID=1775924 RepID=UPI0022264F79|nr:uncharacterized protein CANMA_004872 [Candida margitis]KAI5954033.1 hypothetical protein CANMA_004872 [Candida margitis]